VDSDNNEQGGVGEIVKRGAPLKEEIESNGQRDRRHGRRTRFLPHRGHCRPSQKA
jgi:hypothetical protein